jgi:membrane complex biogenesis BtpA family protein
MTWYRDLFGVDKPIIGLLHLNAFPGDPLFEPGRDSMERNVEDARRDLQALQVGGVDGVLISNEFSLPYECPVSTAVSAGMACVIGELKRELSLPYGIDLEADPLAAMDLAAAVSARFVRGTFTGTYAGVSGIVAPDPATILRRRRALGLDSLRMLYFLTNESDQYITGVDYAELARAIIFNCAPDALCVTGTRAGVLAPVDLIEQVKAGVADLGTPVFAATGCKEDNIARMLAVADGALVGTAFKVDGEFRNSVDPARVKGFMARARAARG